MAVLTRNLRSMPEVIVVERLTLVSEVQPTLGGAPLFPAQPVWLRPGERYWFDEDDRTLDVEDANGEVRTCPCAYSTGPDAVR